MLLHTLLRRLDATASLADLPNIDIKRVREDSRVIEPGELFVARAGNSVDGSQFLGDALRRGAAAAVVSNRLPHVNLPQFVVKDTAPAASVLANHLFSNPSLTSLRVLGITGTNGKTTTAYLLRHMLTAANVRCGMIGTVEINDGRDRHEADLTTPGGCEVAELLGRMRDNGCGACAMEVSSHALHQGRVAGVTFAGAAFTNLTGDHLDYHKTMDAYADAKAMLFRSLPESAAAVVNADDRWSEQMVRDCRARVVRFGLENDADYRARIISYSAGETRFVLSAHGGSEEVTTSLIGRHNVQNLLTAAALAGEVFGLSLRQIAEVLRDAHGAPGRLQAVRAGQSFAVLVDYAHTDDALKNVLQALRPLTRGRLRVLFGCGGDRDRTKRPRMAQIAESMADDVYVTSDNPRMEDPAAIIEEIISGLSRSAAAVEPDRARAITSILTDAREGDVVLIAGKGHEDYQIIGKEKRHFDDVEEVMRWLKPPSAIERVTVEQ